MNILHHKSWHVRNKDNIERVRRDEENARKEEEERLRKVALAESEARTDVLRTRAKANQRNDDVIYEETTSQTTTSGHINFFSDEEQGIKKSGTNIEHETEKKEEKERQEKAIGLLTYLGQSAVEGQTAKPWYYTAPTRSCDTTQASNQIKESDKKAKRVLDPMTMMSKYLSTKRKVEGKAAEPPIKKLKPSTSLAAEHKPHGLMSHSTDEDLEKHKSKHKKKKHKHKKKHKKESSKKHHKDKTEANTSHSKSSSKTMDQLRAERLKRELAERQKTKELFSKLRGETSRDEIELERTMNDRTRGYNSQFNPEFARKPKKKKDWLNMV